MEAEGDLHVLDFMAQLRQRTGPGLDPRRRSPLCIPAGPGPAALRRARWISLLRGPPGSTSRGAMSLDAMELGFSPTITRRGSAMSSSSCWVHRPPLWEPSRGHLEADRVPAPSRPPNGSASAPRSHRAAAGSRIAQPDPVAVRPPWIRAAPGRSTPIASKPTRGRRCPALERAAGWRRWPSSWIGAGPSPGS